MAWIYFQESEESLEPLAIGSDLSRIVKSTPTVRECYAQICHLEESETLQSGMTSDHCPGIGLPDVLISYMEDSPARISALQDMEKAWQGSEADYFGRSIAWPKKSSPSSYSWKTFPPFLHEEEKRLLERLPKWGMIVDGVFYPLKSMLTNDAKDGFYLPNLVACDSKKGPAKEYNRSGKQASMRNLVTISYRIWKAGGLTPEVCEKIMEYPIGWTELKPWAMQWFQAKRKKRLKS